MPSTPLVFNATRPAKSPLMRFGAFGRTNASVAISSPSSRMNSQNRIYAYYKRLGQGIEYQQYLYTVIGTQYRPKVSPRVM